MDGVWSYLFGAPTGQTPNNQIIPRGEICQEAAVVTLNMIRTIIHVVCLLMYFFLFLTMEGYTSNFTYVQYSICSIVTEKRALRDY